MLPTLPETGPGTAYQEIGMANRGALPALYELGLKYIRDGKIPDVSQG